MNDTIEFINISTGHYVQLSLSHFKTHDTYAEHFTVPEASWVRRTQLASGTVNIQTPAATRSVNVIARFVNSLGAMITDTRHQRLFDRSRYFLTASSASATQDPDED